MQICGFWFIQVWVKETVNHVKDLVMNKFNPSKIHFYPNITSYTILHLVIQDTHHLWEQAPAFEQQAPTFTQQARAFTQKATAFMQQALDLTQQSTAFMQQAPSFTEQDPVFLLLWQH